ncbi:hypothetical protein [Sphingomonas suaedae]|nr:hypothetical protein [Sphingomonas suaedae]
MRNQQRATNVRQAHGLILASCGFKEVATDRERAAPERDSRLAGCST